MGVVGHFGSTGPKPMDGGLLKTSRLGTEPAFAFLHGLSWELMLPLEAEALRMMVCTVAECNWSQDRKTTGSMPVRSFGRKNIPHGNAPFNP